MIWNRPPRFKHWVDQRLPAIANNTDFFGEQFVVDETGDFIRREERLLLNSVDASLSEAWEKVIRPGRVVYPRPHQPPGIWPDFCPRFGP